MRLRRLVAAALLAGLAVATVVQIEVATAVVQIGVRPDAIKNGCHCIWGCIIVVCDAPYAPVLVVRR